MGLGAHTAEESMGKQQKVILLKNKTSLLVQVFRICLESIPLYERESKQQISVLQTADERAVTVNFVCIYNIEHSKCNIIFFSFS